MSSPLRDLAAQIEELARNHPAYSQAWQVVRSCSDHLCALAGIEDANQAAIRPVTGSEVMARHRAYLKLSDQLRVRFKIRLMVDVDGNLTAEKVE